VAVKIATSMMTLYLQLTYALRVSCIMPPCSVCVVCCVLLGDGVVHAIHMQMPINPHNPPWHLAWAVCDLFNYIRHTPQPQSQPQWLWLWQWRAFDPDTDTDTDTGERTSPSPEPSLAARKQRCSLHLNLHLHLQLRADK
jgi:hypothetical protein